MSKQDPGVRSDAAKLAHLAEVNIELVAAMVRYVKQNSDISLILLVETIGVCRDIIRGVWRHVDLIDPTVRDRLCRRLEQVENAVDALETDRRRCDRPS